MEDALRLAGRASPEAFPVILTTKLTAAHNSFLASLLRRQLVRKYGCYEREREREYLGACLSYVCI